MVRERIVEGALHEHLAEHLGHQDLAPARVGEQPRALARRALGEVQRPDDPRLLLAEAQHVLLVEGVVAQRDDIGAGLEKVLGMGGGQPHAAGGVLAVDHDEIEPSRLRASAGRRSVIARAAGAADHISKKQDLHAR